MFYVVRKCNQINTSKRGFIGSQFLSFFLSLPLCKSLSLSSLFLHLLIPISISLCVSLSVCVSVCVCVCVYVPLSPFLSHDRNISSALIPPLLYLVSFSSLYLQMTYQLPLLPCQHLGGQKWLPFNMAPHFQCHYCLIGTSL